MDINLRGKRALVCGSTQGIGQAVAIELANLGASITLVARNEDKLKEVVNSLFTTSGQHHNYLAIDFSEIQQFEKEVKKFAAENNKIEILINNTGGPKAGRAVDAELSDYIKAFEQHLICNQILVKALVPLMKKAGFGRIINIVSTSVKSPIPGLGVSNTIRGAVGNWAKTLSFELGPFGITVNNVLPGYTMTSRLSSIIENKAMARGVEKKLIEDEMKSEVPIGRFADPAEVAAMVAFLATPAASYISGANIPVDGGKTMAL